MLTWFQANLGNIIVLLILSAIVFLIIRTIINDRRNGKTGCGGNCGACGMGCACRRRKTR